MQEPEGLNILWKKKQKLIICSDLSRDPGTDGEDKDA